MNPIDALERELVSAAARGPIRRRMPRRTLLLAAALGVVVLAVPAWATGLLRGVFPQSSPPDFGPGVPSGNGQRNYLVASGVSARGERWRVTLEKNTAIQQGQHRPPPAPAPVDRRFACYALAIGPPPQGGGGACAYEGMLAGHPGVALDGVTSGPVTRHDHRTLVHFITARQDVRVAVKLRSGRRFFVRPLQIDRAKLRRSGLRFPFGIVAFTIPRRDGLRGLALVDDRGRVTETFMQPGGVTPAARTLQSPAL